MKPSTKALLIEAAERLFGLHGFDGVSLREIIAAAGQANSNVIQYHFKDRSGLIGAILEDRVQRIEALRRERLEALKTSNQQDVRELLKILWLPTMAVRSADGSHTFCRFLLQYRLQAHIAQHPLFKSDDPFGKATENPQVALSSPVEATRLLRARYENLPEPVLGRRMSALTLMFLASVVEYDNAHMLSDGAPPEFDAEPILDMSIAALSAPG